MQKDFFFQELQNQFTEADFSFRTGQKTAREFSEISLEIFTKILIVYEALEPHVSRLQKAAEENWNKSVAFRKLMITPKTLSAEATPIIEDLKNRFIQTETQYRSKKMQISAYLRAIYDVLIQLLDRAGQIEPYLSQFQQAAVLEWKAKQENILNNKTI